MDKRETKYFINGKDGLRIVGILLVGILKLSNLLKKDERIFRNKVNEQNTLWN